MTEFNATEVTVTTETEYLDTIVFPPLNGTPTSLDDTTDYVAPLNPEGA